MNRIAVPIFQSRISPVLDSCTRIVVVDIDQNREVERKEVYLDELSLSERLHVLQNSHVTTVICGGITEVFHNMLSSAHISVITGIAGEAEEVVTAFIADRLDDERFVMPGYRKQR
jgi:predicted Fe-Mo cluster-binding NifX family protein